MWALGKDEERRSYFQLAYDSFLHDERYVYEVKFESKGIKALSQS